MYSSHTEEAVWVLASVSPSEKVTGGLDLHGGCVNKVIHYETLISWYNAWLRWRSDQMLAFSLKKEVFFFMCVMCTCRSENNMGCWSSPPTCPVWVRVCFRHRLWGLSCLHPSSHLWSTGYCIQYLMHGCVASALSTEPSPQPGSFYYCFTTECLALWWSVFIINCAESIITWETDPWKCPWGLFWLHELSWEDSTQVLAHCLCHTTHTSIQGLNSSAAHCPVFQL